MSLFSGVGALDLGLASAGTVETVAFCENWESARSVLEERFPNQDIFSDVTDLKSFDGVDLVAAGFPCTDLSSAGLGLGLDGEASGLVRHVLEVVRTSKPPWILLENVPNMLRLKRGHAIGEITDHLEKAGYNWAYRVIDSRSFGLPQRRRRVFVLASRVGDPASILFREEEDLVRADGAIRGAWDNAFGFYWTEGNRGLGWAVDAVPTLKGSTTVSIPSPPAVWLPHAQPGYRIVRPSVMAGEALQGLPANWTSAAPPRDRWKLVGNAVSVPVARWIGAGLRGAPALDDTLRRTPRVDGSPWPDAAYHGAGKTWDVDISDTPSDPSGQRIHLRTVLRRYGSEPLSARATRGFRDRLAASTLSHPAQFMADLNEHLAVHRS